MKSIVGVIPAPTIIQNVETNGSASPYAQEVHFNTPTGATATTPGGISSRSPQQIYVIQNLVNLAGQNIDSTDITVDYTWKAGAIGKFDINSVWTWFNKDELQQIPTEPFYNYTGEATQNLGTVPKWRTYTTASWKNFGAEAVIGVTYISSVEDQGVGGDSAVDSGRVASFVAWDGSLSYDFKHLHMGKAMDGLKVTVGVDNAFDAQPPVAIAAFPNTNADVGEYDGPIGRMYYVKGSYKF